MRNHNFWQEGSVSLHGSAWYVGHAPWIIEGTVQENILLGSELREQRLAQVMSVCGLVPSIQAQGGFVQGSKVLAGGKLSSTTHIRDGGVGLSLATRQKIAMARAVYNARDLYLMDEPLSAVPQKVRDN